MDAAIEPASGEDTAQDSVSVVLLKNGNYRVVRLVGAVLCCAVLC
ncbi:hypothetical protein [Xanthomonas arboricola]|nr:hypothetical protein [Xanthomonas arboricola]